MAAPLKRLAFETGLEFRNWLEKNHAGSEGIWLRFFKKDSGRKTVTYAEALDQALCFGWIDGQVLAHDRQSWLQRFTPRRPKSAWSKRNTSHVERLTEAGQMAPAGLRAVAAAKADGRWQAAYDSPRNAAPPADFLEALAKNQKAKTFFATLNRANVYAIVYRLQTAKKPETRERRMKMILETLRRGKKFIPESAEISGTRNSSADSRLPKSGLRLLWDHYGNPFKNRRNRIRRRGEDPGRRFSQARIQGHHRDP